MITLEGETKLELFPSETNARVKLKVARNNLRKYGPKQANISLKIAQKSKSD